MRTRDARSLPSIAQEDLRRKAMKAVLDGKKQAEVAEVFGVTRQAVGKWVKAYRGGGAYQTGGGADSLWETPRSGRSLKRSTCEGA